MGIISQIYRATVTVQVVTIFYILVSGESDITRGPFEKLGQLRDQVLGRKPITAPIASHSHH